MMPQNRLLMFLSMRPDHPSQIDGRWDCIPREVEVVHTATHQADWRSR